MPDLMTPAEVADFLRLKPRTVTEVYAKRPDFPTPFILSESGTKVVKRWRRADIIHWLERTNSANP